MSHANAGKLHELRAKTDRQLLVLFVRHPARYRRLATCLLHTLPPAAQQAILDDLRQEGVIGDGPVPAIFVVEKETPLKLDKL